MESKHIKQIFNNNSFHIEYKKVNRKKLQEILDEYGVVVIEDYFKFSKCNEYMKSIVDWLILNSDNLTMDHKTWLGKNLPNGPRVGMMQSIISHCPTIWEIREKMYQLFKVLWGDEDLITSIDGATIYPPKKSRKTKDWPHLDQTLLEPKCICYQGEAVLTNTTAAFVCSPKSHKIHKEILEACNKKPSKSHWLKFNKQQIEKVKRMVLNTGGKWQIPIYAPAGSLILWRSTTIHSAQRIVESVVKIPNDIWLGWRGVVYVCMRPKSHLTKTELTRLRKAATEGRTTNHWGTKIFPKNGRYKVDRGEKLNKLHDNPETLVFNNTVLLNKLVNNEF